MSHTNNKEVERIEEIIENIVAGVAEYPHGRLALAVDLREQLRTILHQELQKARAEMLHKLHLCAIGKYEGDALENVKAQIAESQSELDQPLPDKQ